jgi:hypothetical protein
VPVPRAKFRQQTVLGPPIRVVDLANRIVINGQDQIPTPAPSLDFQEPFELVAAFVALKKIRSQDRDQKLSLIQRLANAFPPRLSPVYVTPVMEDIERLLRYCLYGIDQGVPEPCDTVVAIVVAVIA